MTRRQSNLSYSHAAPNLVEFPGSHILAKDGHRIIMIASDGNTGRLFCCDAN